MERAVKNAEPALQEVNTQNELITELFKKHNDALIKFLRARLRSDADAHEVAQEAYVKLLDLDKPDAISYLKAYLFRIASNLAIDKLRSKQRNSIYKPLTFFEMVGQSQEQQALKEEQLSLITQFVNELPPKCRKAFLLNRLHGLSTDEIASLMNISDRMVRKYLVRATEYCRVKLDEHHEGH